MPEKKFKPPKFPLHSLVVHMPVGLWSAALFFDLLSRVHVGGNPMVRLSFWLIAFGLAGAFVAIPTGLLDWSGVKKGKPARKLGLYHMATNLIVTLLLFLPSVLCSIWGALAGLRSAD